MSLAMYSDYVKDNCFSKYASFLWPQIWETNSKFIFMTLALAQTSSFLWFIYTASTRYVQLCAKRRMVQSRSHITSECSSFPVENTEHDSLVIDVTVQIWRGCDAELQGLYVLVWRSVICDVKQKQYFSLRYEINAVQLPNANIFFIS